MQCGMRIVQFHHRVLARAFRHLACVTALTMSAAFGIAQDLRSLPDPVSPLKSAQSTATTELSEAAARIEQGDDTGAIRILTRHLAAHPEHVTVRAYLAEIHFRRGEWCEAQLLFDRFIQEGQLVELELPRLVHGHTRLMAIAEKLGDKYAEHVHRGIGLFWLAQQASVAEDVASERYLCAAAGELARAERLHPDRARPHWYRYRVWQQLGQTAAARTALRIAIRNAPFSDLTRAEQLALANARDAEFSTVR